jgi:hypothetical protein
MKKLIIVEFNELSYSLILKFMDRDLLPNFKYFHTHGQIKFTDANEKGSLLNPWVQWVTAHTGKEFNEHQVARLNESKKASEHFIWNKLSIEGKKCWICGSMNTSIDENFNGFYIPDPWSTDSKAYPQEKFKDYMNFVIQSVQGHNTGTQVSPKDFLTFMMKNGLRFKTIFKTVLQLISEKLDPTKKWKRAGILDMLQFDLFRSVLKKESPDFSTFFLNSVAHYQHHYWDAFDPSLFTNENIPTDSRKSAILEGYKSMDRILGDLMNITDSSTEIILCTGLSQVPYNHGTTSDSKRYYYRIINSDLLDSKFNLKENYIYKPVMAEQFHLEFKTEEQASKTYKYLKQYKMESNDYFHVGSNDLFLLSLESNIVYVQCRCTKQVNTDAKIISPENEAIDFYSVFYDMKDVKTGVHDPKGLFWILNSKKKASLDEQPVSLTKIYTHSIEYFN